eukprot:751776-Hanusia_phi.AAC.6
MLPPLRIPPPVVSSSTSLPFRSDEVSRKVSQRLRRSLLKHMPDKLSLQEPPTRQVKIPSPLPQQIAESVLLLPSPFFQPILQSSLWKEASKGIVRVKSTSDSRTLTLQAEMRRREEEEVMYVQVFRVMKEEERLRLLKELHALCMCKDQ